MNDRRKQRRKQHCINKKLRKIFLGNVDCAKCCYCNKQFPTNQLTIEHKIPLCMGGTSNIENIDIACGPCNRAKGKEAWQIQRKLNRERFVYEQQQNC